MIPLCVCSDPYDCEEDDLFLDSDEEREEGNESTKMRPMMIEIDLDLSAMANARRCVSVYVYLPRCNIRTGKELCLYCPVAKSTIIQFAFEIMTISCINYYWIKFIPSFYMGSCILLCLSCM